MFNQQVLFLLKQLGKRIQSWIKGESPKIESS